MYAPITNVARLFFLSLESVKALFIWSWVPDKVSWRTIACNMGAMHANCATFWTYKHCEEL